MKFRHAEYSQCEPCWYVLCPTTRHLQRHNITTTLHYSVHYISQRYWNTATSCCSHMLHYMSEFYCNRTRYIGLPDSSRSPRVRLLNMWENTCYSYNFTISITVTVRNMTSALLTLKQSKPGWNGRDGICATRQSWPGWYGRDGIRATRQSWPGWNGQDGTRAMCQSAYWCTVMTLIAVCSSHLMSSCVRVRRHQEHK